MKDYKPLILIILIAVGIFGFLNRPVEVKQGIDATEDAPPFDLVTIGGESVSLASIMDEEKATILYFTATWCPFCKEELKTVNSIYPEYRDRVRFIAVDLDLTETVEDIERVYGSNPSYSEIEFAPGNREMIIAYDARTTTSKVAITKNGKIAFKEGTYASVLGEDKWREIFEALL